jgi:general secretion pathway protein H
MTLGVQTIPDSEAGFTLLEMIVVLAILALAVGIAAPVLTRPSDGARLQTAASELKAALRATRAAAIATGSEATLMIDVDRKAFQSPAVPRRRIASDIDAKLTFASALRSGVPEGGFRFFPDGSSTGGDVTLSLRGRQARICVDWLTGQVRQEQTC